jgi:tripartite-type tricarboxylate transporter receptor subunit TctC
MSWRIKFAPWLGVAFLLLVAQARAQTPDPNFPTRPIRIIVAVPAGGGVDLSTRIAAEALHRLWGQPVTVENRTGGGNNIAGEMVAKADPDGYTLLATPPNIVTANAALYKQLNYDPAALEPVAVMAVGPNVLAVKNTLPANTVAELIALAKGNPGRKTRLNALTPCPYRRRPSMTALDCTMSSISLSA